MALLDVLTVLLQNNPTAQPGFVGVGRFFIGFALVLTFYTGALLFTYWISKDE